MSLIIKILIKKNRSEPNLPKKKKGEERNMLTLKC